MRQQDQGDPPDPSDQQKTNDSDTEPTQDTNHPQQGNPKQQKRYLLLKDSDQLDIEFYQAFDESFLYNKAITLQWAIEHAEEFTPQLEQTLVEWGAISALSDKYVESLRAELFFMALQQFEAFFALLIAPFQDMPDWVYLTDYKTGEIEAAIQQFYSGDISPLTNGFTRDTKEFLTQAIYCGITPSVEEELALWEESLDSIDWIISRAANLYLKNRGAYNSYKHGLRMMTGETQFGIRLNDADGNSQGQGMVRTSKDSLIFLELKKSDRGTVVNETLLHFNASEAFFYCHAMHLLLTNIKVTRLAAYTKQPLMRQPIAVGKLDKDQLAREWAGGGLRFTIGPRV